MAVSPPGMSAWLMSRSRIGHLRPRRFAPFDQRLKPSSGTVAGRSSQLSARISLTLKSTVSHLKLRSPRRDCSRIVGRNSPSRSKRRSNPSTDLSSPIRFEMIVDSASSTTGQPHKVTGSWTSSDFSSLLTEIGRQLMFLKNTVKPGCARAYARESRPSPRLSSRMRRPAEATRPS